MARMLLARNYSKMIQKSSSVKRVLKGHIKKNKNQFCFGGETMEWN